MDDYSKLSASDGTGEAVVANVETDRLSGATTLNVDNVDNWPTNFICVTGTLNPNNYIDNSSMSIFYGHLDAGNIVIDSFADGYTDVGNTAGQIAVIKPTTEWVNQIIALAKVSHNDNGTIKNDAITSETMFTDNVDPVKRDDETSFDHVASGGVWSGDSYGSTRNASMTALVAYINGQRGTIAAVTARSFTASKDTYVDILNTAGVFSLVYTEVANNAASPALASNSIRIAIIVTGASSIANVGSINQGQEDKVLPIASSVAYTVTDSLGNLICNRDPSMKLIGYRQATSLTGSITTTVTDLTGLTAVPFIVPENRKIKIIQSQQVTSTVAGDVAQHYVREGATVISDNYVVLRNANNQEHGHNETIKSTTSGLHTYKASLNRALGSGTLSGEASAGRPSYLRIELY